MCVLRVVWHASSWLLVWAVGVLLYLRALCLGRPPWSALGGAGLGFLALALLGLLLAPVIGGAPVWVSGVLGGVGFAWGLYLLRRYLRDVAPLGPGDRLRIALVLLVAGGAAGYAAGRHQGRLLSPLDERESAAIAAGEADEFTIAGALRLDAATARVIEGPYRNFDLRATLTLAPDSVLELRSRATSSPGVVGGSARGIALLVSTDPRLDTGFVVQTASRFEPIGEASRALDADQPFELHLRVQGDHFEAFIDGESVAQARSRRHAAGAITVLAARGSGQVRELSVIPGRGSEDPPSPWARVLLAAVLPLLFLALYAWLTGRLLGLPFAKVLEAQSFALIPFSVTLFLVLPGARLESASVVTGSASILLLLMVPMVHPKAVTPLRLAVLGLLALFGAWAEHRFVTDRADLPLDMNR